MSWALLLAGAAVAFADDPAPEATPPAPPPAEAAPAEEADAGEVIEVWGDPAVARAREALNLKLKEEGYRKGARRDDRTIYRSYTPWAPRVIVHDDGWVYVKREPPRVHSPGKSFSDQGSPAAYLWCVLAPTACVSIGGWMVGPRKYAAMEGRVLDATHAEVNALNEAVARRQLALRVNKDIPGDLEKIWALSLPATERRALIFEFWDTRTETPEGEAARDAVESFIRGVVQGSAEPYSPEEIAANNAKRTVAREFLPTAAPPAP